MTFSSVDEVMNGLGNAQYLADDAIATTVYLSSQLKKPVLVEGPAGTGKTELAKAVARFTGSRLIRLQCYEGLDESKALYEWDYKRQLLRIQAAGHSDSNSWAAIKSDVFDEEFLLSRPLLEAIRADDPVVLLIDEVDRVEVETEALLLEVLSDYQVSIPEFGTLTAKQVPMVFLTSNNTRDLSEALKRRCLFLHLGYPSIEREQQIIRTHIPEIESELAASVAKAVVTIREMDLQKHPSVSETLDWARTLVLMNTTDVTNESLREGLPTLLKHQGDIEKVSATLTFRH